VAVHVGMRYLARSAAALGSTATPANIAVALAKFYTKSMGVGSTQQIHCIKLWNGWVRYWKKKRAAPDGAAKGYPKEVCKSAVTSREAKKLSPRGNLVPRALYPP